MKDNPEEAKREVANYMTITTIRTLFDYHYARFGQIWERIMALDEARFAEAVPYSVGSLRNQITHVLDDDTKWTTFLATGMRTSIAGLDGYQTRAAVRQLYDTTVSQILETIHSFDDELLTTTFVWQPPHLSNPQHLTGEQVLLHMVNHGTDHRAQILRILHDFGAPTFDQDLMGYLIESGTTGG